MDGGTDVPIGAGNTRGCQAVNKNKSLYRKAWDLTVSLLRIGATYLRWEFGESSGLEL